MILNSSGAFDNVASLYSIENGFMKVELTNIGATIFGIWLPDKNGEQSNIVLSYDNLEDYLTNPFYIGSTIGRVAGRISKSSFLINNERFILTKASEMDNHHLHGGKNGFNKKIFTVSDFTDRDDKKTVEFRYKSMDGEEGYPGNLELVITYCLSPDNKLTIRYKAWTDKPTHVNLTNHSYFNLTGDKSKALEQELYINASKILQTDNDYIPTGEIKEIKNTPFDFSYAHTISLMKDHLLMPGYNECYLLDKMNDIAAVLSDHVSGRQMLLHTSYPSLIFYTGDYLQDPFLKSEGICLEAQYFPDSPNNALFNGTLLLPGQLYEEYISYQFLI